MSDPRMLIYAQCGRRHYPTDDLTANVAAYRLAFGLPEATRLIGRVHRQLRLSPESGSTPASRSKSQLAKARVVAGN